MTDTPQDMPETPPEETVSDGQEPLMILTFRMKGERFALEVTHVNEILDPIGETRVPNAPPWAPSLINVRGSVVPMFDIRHRLGLGKGAPVDTARVVVLDVLISGELTRLAVQVEAVEDVIEANADTFELIPELGARWPAEFIEGVAQHNGDLVVLLNAKALFQVDRRETAAA